MSNALKIEIMTSFSGNDPVYGETLYFDEDETRSILVTNNAECQILESMKQHPQVNDGSKYEDPDSQRDAHIVSVNIFHAYSSTKTNLTTLFSYKNLFKVYYKYITDPTAFYLCILDPNRSEKYTSGFEEAEIVTTLKFYETYNFKADGTAYLTNGISVTPEVIIDPDDKNIRLDGNTDIISISPITQSMDIVPGRAGIIENNDISITIANPLNITRTYNNADTSTDFNPFRAVNGRPYWEATSGETSIDLSVYTSAVGIYEISGNSVFKIGDAITIADGINSEDFIVLGTTLTSETLEYPGGGGETAETQRQTININAPLVNNYSIFASVQTWSMINKKVIVRLRVENEYQKGTKSISTYTVFSGTVKEQPKVNGNTSTITVENYANKVLNKPLLITATSPTPTYRCNSSGTLAETISWPTQTGNGTLSGVTVYSGAIPGYWEVTFSNATDFTVNGPNCSAKAGSTASDFYDQTDATDSQIKIASASWGGTPENGDVLAFYVSVNFNSKKVPDIVRELLVTYGGITATTEESIVVTGDTYHAFTLSYDSPCTIGEAISSVLMSGRYYLTYTFDGKFKITRLSYFEYFSAEDNYIQSQKRDLSYGAYKNKTIRIGRTEIINNFICYYAWDYENLTYGKTISYPIKKILNSSHKITGILNSVTLYFPGAYDILSVTNGVSQLFRIYQKGLDICQIELPIQQANLLEVGSMLCVPLYGGRLGFYITDKEINFSNNSVLIKGINLGQF